MYCQLFQLLLILLAVVARHLYAELDRARIKNVRLYNYGDAFTVLLSCGLGGWAMLELWLIQVWGQSVPRPSLMASLNFWLWVSTLLPVSLRLLQSCLKLWLGDVLAGMGRGCLSFGLPIALVARLCWFSVGS